MSSKAQRKAWNEAMRNAGAVLPSSSSAAAASSSSILAAATSSLASDRSRKATRREKARKSSSYASGLAGGGAASLAEERRYRVAIHLDMLEGVVDNSAVLDDNDDEYDEFEELDLQDTDDGDGEEGSKKRKRKRSGNAASSSSNAALPKYLRPRSLASILIEEASRSDSMAKRYVDAAVKSLSVESGNPGGAESNSNVITKRVRTITRPYPPRKFCPVTGLLGEYTDPKSGISYSSLSALEQIRERAPPWMNVANGGTASYWEAVNTLKSDL
ncbi:hypothetical protein HJC23_004471 [Cyclotella cryptica]|uniref:Vps72/YL1 C-terminal domain-containing protein n=1 Tax=Cyclotella cryptica TaxID=29204 RepID=A0ABD3QM22_9STRA|eukprot:CCRYP_006096-RA/>CCRYP_006096-RA protein AED:0.03 eAED:0.03 QI:206/1/1/1/0/0/2/639/272